MFQTNSQVGIYKTVAPLVSILLEMTSLLLGHTDSRAVKMKLRMVWPLSTCDSRLLTD